MNPGVVLNFLAQVEGSFSQYYGLLVSAGISLVIAITGGWMAIGVFARRRDPKTLPIAFSFAVFWAVIALDYLFASGRFTAAFFGQVKLDAVFFMITNAFGSAMVIPIVFLSLYVITRKTLPGIIGGIVMVLVWILWLGLIYSGGLSYETHVVTYWYSKWQYNSSLSGPISLYGLYLPGAAAALAMFFGLLRAQTKLARYRLIMTICSMVLTGTLIMVDFLLTDPVIAVGIRAAILAAVLLGALGYFPPGFIRKGLEKD